MTSLSSIVRGRFEKKTYALWLAIALASLFAAHELWLMYATHVYVGLIQNTNEIVTIDDSLVTVINGTSQLPTRARHEAARLAYAKTLVRRQPLFSLEGTDIDTLTRALNELETGEIGLAQTQRTEIEKERVASLYDTDLIRAAVNTEQERRSFLSEGSAPALARYVRAQAYFVSRYRKGLEAFEKNFRASIPPDSKSYATAQHVITHDSMIGALHTLSRRSTETANILSRDRLCFGGFVFTCREAKLPTVTSSAKEPITESSRSLSREARELYAHMRSVNTPLGSTIVTEESTCIDSRYAQPLFALREYGVHFLPLASTTRITHIGNIRLVETASAQDVPFFALHHEKHIPYAPVFEFNFYSCPLMDDDVARISATQLVHERVVSNPFSTLLGDEELSELEFLLSQSEIYESDARRYVQTALERAQGTDARLVNEILPYALMLEKRTAGFERTIADIALMTHSQLARTQHNMPIAALDPASLYMFRNGVVPLFFGNNVTFGTENVTFSAKPDSLDEPFTYLSELRNAGVPLAAIIKSLHDYYEPTQ